MSIISEAEIFLSTLHQCIKWAFWSHCITTKSSLKSHLHLSAGVLLNAIYILHCLTLNRVWFHVIKCRNTFQIH